MTYLQPEKGQGMEHAVLSSAISKQVLGREAGHQSTQTGSANQASASPTT